MDTKPSHTPAPRLVTAVRNQSEIREICLDGMLPEDHRVRHLWTFVESADLSGFLSRIKSVEGNSGRPATDPRILLTLWLYATSQGIGSARRLSELCQSDIAYLWICGSQTINHHTLSDFRSRGAQALDRLMRTLLTGLVSSHILTLRRVSQDGVKVRTSAGAASFRRKNALKDLEAQIGRQIEDLKKELGGRSQASNKREQAARDRALRERQAKVAKALKDVEALQAAIDESPSVDKRKREARASTTDPDARVMHMADGGFRPAMNIQLATDTDTRLVVGVEATNSGVDAGMMAPMMELVERNTGELPEELLVDGGYVSHKDIQAVSEMGIAVVAPPKIRLDQKSPLVPRKGDTLEIAAWRLRMARPETSEIYRQRASTSETVHADLRKNRGLLQFPVRGMERIQAVALLMAVTYNALRIISMGWM